MRHFRPTKRFSVNMGADTIRAATGSEQVEELDETAGQKRDGARCRKREGEKLRQSGARLAEIT